MGGRLVAPPQKLAQTSVLVDLKPATLKPGSTPLVVGVYVNGRRVQTIKTAFIGPH